MYSTVVMTFVSFELFELIYFKIDLFFFFSNKLGGEKRLEGRKNSKEEG